MTRPYDPKYYKNEESINLNRYFQYDVVWDGIDNKTVTWTEGTSKKPISFERLENNPRRFGYDN
jgi:hypothetical protein